MVFQLVIFYKHMTKWIGEELEYIQKKKARRGPAKSLFVFIIVFSMFSLY